MWLTRHMYSFLFSIAVISSILFIRSQLQITKASKVAGTLKRIEKHYFNNLMNSSSANFTFASLYEQYYKDEWNYSEDNEWFEQDEVEPIYFLGLFELSTKFGVRKEATSEIAAAELAVKQVNNLNMLPGYELKIIINDTQCDPGVGIDRFFYALYSNYTISMLLASGCSNVTESLAQIVPYWNILQVSYGALSPSLSDQNKFPLFFRTIASDSAHNQARLAFIRHFRWSTVAMFSQSEVSYLLPLTKLINELERQGIICLATITFSPGNYKEKLKELKVFDLEMFGADYVWILKDQLKYWWHKYDLQACASRSIRLASEGIIFISDFESNAGAKEITSSGLTNFEFTKCLKNITYISKNVRHIFDAVWAMALSLKISLSQYNYSKFTYEDKDFVNHVKKEFGLLDFLGMSGPVQFNGSERVGNSILKQIQGGELNTIAIYNPKSDTLDFDCKVCFPIQWQGNTIPISRRILKTYLITIPKYLFYTIFAVCITGLSACLIYLGLSIHYRRIQTVNLSSTKLNHIGITGCIFIYMAVILFGVDIKTNEKSFGVSFNYICMGRVYLLSTGFSLAFGSIFAKIYRIYRIFAINKLTLITRENTLQDHRLIMLIVLPLFIDGLIAICWTIVDPLKRRLHNLKLEVIGNERGVLYQPQVEFCGCNSTSGWFIAICGYKAILLIMGCYMAWKIRHIKLKAAEDSGYIGICVYSAAAACVVLLLTNYLTDYTLLSYLVRSGSILFTTTLSLCLLFLSNLRPILKYRGGLNEQEEVQVTESMDLKIECNTVRYLTDNQRVSLQRIEVQNMVYKCELEALDREIERLEDLLADKEAKASSKLSGILTRGASWPASNAAAPALEPVQQKGRLQYIDPNCPIHARSLSVHGNTSKNVFNRFRRLFESFSHHQRPPPPPTQLRFISPIPTSRGNDHHYVFQEYFQEPAFSKVTQAHVANSNDVDDDCSSCNEMQPVDCVSGLHGCVETTTTTTADEMDGGLGVCGKGEDKAGEDCSSPGSSIDEIFVITRRGGEIL